MECFLFVEPESPWWRLPAETGARGDGDHRPRPVPRRFLWICGNFYACELCTRAKTIFNSIHFKAENFVVEGEISTRENRKRCSTRYIKRRFLFCVCAEFAKTVNLTGEEGLQDEPLQLISGTAESSRGVSTHERPWDGGRSRAPGPNGPHEKRFPLEHNLHGPRERGLEPNSSLLKDDCSIAYGSASVLSGGVSFQTVAKGSRGTSAQGIRWFLA